MRNLMMTRRTLPAASIAAVLAALGLGCLTTVAAPKGPKTVHPTVKIKTSLGEITLELDAEIAPLTVMNFLDYARDGFYNGTIFHRVTDAVIQGGGYTPDLKEKTEGHRSAIREESRRGRKNERGTIAMYRNPLIRNSAKSQFFINLKDNPSLDLLRDRTAYTVFGHVTNGFDVVKKIGDSPLSTHPNYAAGLLDVVPVKPVVIKSIVLVTKLDRRLAKLNADAFRERELDPVGFWILDLLRNNPELKVHESATGLRYIDHRVGSGAFPLDDDTVEIDFVGTLVDGTEFDSSVTRWNKPGKLPVNTLLKGLREGILGMREGGVRTLIVPPGLGFAELGKPPLIHPGDTLFFKIELLGLSRKEK